MKKIRLLSLLAISSLLSFSCDESFNPKTDFQESAVLFCIVQANPRGSNITATLSRVYDVNGFDPSANRVDPAITGAKITLSARDWSVVLHEDSVERKDSSRYQDQFTYYGGRASIYPYDVLSVVAQLPDGVILSASTQVPVYKTFDTFPPFVNGVTTRVNPFTLGTAWIFDWEDDLSEEHLFFPQLRIWYALTSDPTHVMSQPVPFRYIQRENGMEAVYPSYVWEKSCSFDFAAIDSAMARISAGEPNKDKYIVTGVTFSVVEYDFALSRYFSSTNGYLDQYSVRLDETVFSNVHGGIGLFGSTNTTSITYEFQKSYVLSFGYRTQ